MTRPGWIIGAGLLLAGAVGGSVLLSSAGPVAPPVVASGKKGQVLVLGAAGQAKGSDSVTLDGGTLTVLDGTGHVVATISASGTEWIANTLGVDGGLDVDGTITGIGEVLDGGTFRITNGAGGTVASIDTAGRGVLSSVACSLRSTLPDAGIILSESCSNGSVTFQYPLVDAGTASVTLNPKASLSAGNPSLFLTVGDQATGAGIYFDGTTTYDTRPLQAPNYDGGNYNGATATFSTSLTVAGVGVVGGAPLSASGYQLAALGTGVNFGCTKALSAGHVGSLAYTPQVAGGASGTLTVGWYDGATRLCDFVANCATAAGTPTYAPAGNCDDGGAAQAYVAGDGLCFQIEAASCLGGVNPTGDASAQGK